jgi:hypothetical protein
MLTPTGLIRGHYECRSFDQTLPILNDILALEVVAEKNGETTLKHPNTDWRLVVHENGPDAPIKPMRNHYGVRVTSNAEVDRATEHLEARKEQLGIKVIKPRENHNAYSVHFYEPGGNYWEIESYEHAVEAGMGETTNPHWTQPLPAERFSAKGYVPQALTMALWKMRISKHPSASTAKSSVSQSSNCGRTPVMSNTRPRPGTWSAFKR